LINIKYGNIMAKFYIFIIQDICKTCNCFEIEAPQRLVAGELRLFSKFEFIFWQKIILLTHLSHLSG
jgi:hypothetical protein